MKVYVRISTLSMCSLQVQQFLLPLLKSSVQIQIQKCSLDRNVTSATYKLVFSNVLRTYKTTKLQ